MIAPLGRAELSARTRLALTVLRAYVIIAVPMVVYAFVQALRNSSLFVGS